MRHAVETKGEAVAFLRRRGNRIGAGNLLAGGLAMLERQPLSGDEIKSWDALHFKFEVLGLVRESDRAGETSGEGSEGHPLL